MNLAARRGGYDDGWAGRPAAYQEWAFTKKGRSLFPVLVALRQWSETFFFEPESHVGLVDRKHGMPVWRFEVYSQDGRLLGPEEKAIRRFEVPSHSWMP